MLGDTEGLLLGYKGLFGVLKKGVFMDFKLREIYLERLNLCNSMIDKASKASKELSYWQAERKAVLLLIADGNQLTFLEVSREC